MSIFMYLFIADFLFPKKCLGCSRNGSYFCQRCISKQEKYEAQRCIKCQRLSLDGLTHPKCKSVYLPEGVFVIYRYKNILKKLVKDVKFRRLKSLDNELTQLYANLDERLINYWVKNQFIVTSVPISRTKLNKRGFNQAELLAKKFANINDLEYQNFLSRKRDTRAQFGLNRKERFQNIANSFTLKKKFKKGTNLLLVDDVITTGVTAIECVKVLKRNRAGKVWVLVLAG